MTTTTNSTTKGAQSIPELAPLAEVKAGKYLIQQLATVGTTYYVECPVCHHMLTVAPKTPGTRKIGCPHCQTIILFKAVSPQSTQSPSPNPQSSATNNQPPVTNQSLPTEVVLLPPVEQHRPGRLTWGLLGHKSRKLSFGTYVIGRKNDKEPSDIEFDDDYMSRRSVSIEVAKAVGYSGFSFKLTVLRAKNPVMAAGKLLGVGDSLYLNYSDTIKLGNTILTFKESK